METGSKNSNVDMRLLADAGANLHPPAATSPAPGAPPPGAPAPAVTNWRQEAREIWGCVALLSMRFPSVKEVYTEEVLDRLAEVWAPVLERHNLDMGKFMIYFAAGAATLPVIGATIEAVKADRARMIAEAGTDPGEPAPAAKVH